MKKKKKDIKKKYENVVINNTPLIPTTIGEIVKEEGSLVTIIGIFILLIVGIFVIPFVADLITEKKENETNPPVVSSKPSNPTNPEVTENPSDTENYLDIDVVNEQNILGFNFQLQFDKTLHTLNLTIENRNGNSKLFINNNYYVELYSENHQFLQRLKIDREELVSKKVYDFDISSAYQIDNVKYFLITEKNASDYPGINVANVNDNDQPYLLCQTNNENLVYTFNLQDNSYVLERITDRIIVTDTTEENIAEYEGIAQSYNKIKGVTADIYPSTEGFQFEANIDLNNVNLNSNSDVLNNKAYYPLDTEAKVIKFELEASGYSCK